MALSGVHITWGAAEALQSRGGAAVALPFNATASETMASATTSTTTASAPPSGGRPMLSISASAAIFYVTGPNPNINTGPRRYFDPSLNSREDIFVNAGDKIAWTTA